MTNVARLIGIALVLLGIFARRFHVGLSERAPTSPWFGRTWLVGFGVILIMSTTPLPGRVAATSRHLSCGFFSIFAMASGLTLAVAAARVTLSARAEKRWRIVWLAFAIALGGMLLAVDGWLGVFCN